MAHQIRVLYSSTKGKASFLETLKDNDNQYEQRIQSLKNFRSHSKQKVNERNYIQEWIVEQNDLVKALDRHEKVKAEILQTLLLSGLESGTIESLLDEDEQLKHSRRTKRRSYDQQMRDLKRFLSDQTKAVNHKTQLTPDATVSNTDNDSFNIKSAVCAEVFLKLRLQFSNEWSALRAEEEYLRHETEQTNQQTTKMLHDEILQNQDLVLHEELLSLADTADDPDILELLTSTTQQITAIDQQFEQLSARKLEEMQKLCSDIGLQVDEKSSFGGWQPSEHDIFVKIYRNAEVKGAKRTLMLQQLQLQLVSKSQDDVLQHEEWYRGCRVIKTRYRETEQQLTVTRQDIITTAKNSVAKLKADRLEAQERELDLQAQEEKRRTLHHRLETMRTEKLQLEHQKSLQQAAEEAEIAIREEESNLQLQIEQEKKKKLIEEYQRQKVLMEEEHRRQQVAAEAIAAERTRALIEANKGRIEFRAQQFDHKQQQKRQKEEELLQKEQKKIEFLQQLASTVPYWSQIQEAVSKLDHITVAVKGQEYSKPEEQTRGHLPLNSFNDHSIIKDARFRLAEALSRANVQHSEAARQVVQQFHPRPHLAIHGLL